MFRAPRMKYTVLRLLELALHLTVLRGDLPTCSKPTPFTPHRGEKGVLHVLEKVFSYNDILAAGPI